MVALTTTIISFLPTLLRTALHCNTAFYVAEIISSLFHDKVTDMTHFGRWYAASVQPCLHILDVGIADILQTENVHTITDGC